MDATQLFESFIVTLRQQLSSLDALLEKGELPTQLASDLKHCCDNALNKVMNADNLSMKDCLSGVLRALQPVVELTKLPENLDTHENAQVRRIYEAAIYQLNLIELVVRSNTQEEVSFYKLDISLREYSVLPWLNDLMIPVARLVETVIEDQDQAPRPLHMMLREMQKFASKFMSHISLSQEPIELKGEGIAELVPSFFSSYQFPPPYEQELVIIRQALEDAAPLGAYKQLVAHYNNSRYNLPVELDFFDRVEAALPVLQRYLAELCDRPIFSPKQKSLLDKAQNKIDELKQETQLRGHDYESHAEPARKLLLALALIGTLLNNNEALATNNDNDLQTLAEGCRCLLNHIATGAEDHLCFIGFRRPEALRELMPLRRHIDEAMDEMGELMVKLKEKLPDNTDSHTRIESLYPFYNQFSHILITLDTNTDPASALSHKQAAASALARGMLEHLPPKQIMNNMAHCEMIGETEVRPIWLMMASELAALTRTLARHVRPDQQETLLQRLDYSPIARHNYGSGNSLFPRQPTGLVTRLKSVVAYMSGNTPGSTDPQNWDELTKALQNRIDFLAISFSDSSKKKLRTLLDTIRGYAEADLSTHQSRSIIRVITDIQHQLSPDHPR